jgi:hypothetical protein
VREGSATLRPGGSSHTCPHDFFASLRYTMIRAGLTGLKVGLRSQDLGKAYSSTDPKQTHTVSLRKDGGKKKGVGNEAINGTQGLVCCWAARQERGCSHTKRGGKWGVCTLCPSRTVQLPFIFLQDLYLQHGI